MSIDPVPFEIDNNLSDIMKIECSRCQEILKKKGAIILSPPIEQDGIDIVQKYHICIKCWDWLIKATADKKKKKQN